MSTKERVIHLIEAMSEPDLLMVERMLCQIIQPQEYTWDTAPMDDEPFTREEQAEDEAALVEITRGEVVPHEAMIRRLRER